MCTKERPCNGREKVVVWKPEWEVCLFTKQYCRYSSLVLAVPNVWENKQKIVCWVSHLNFGILPQQPNQINTMFRIHVNTIMPKYYKSSSIQWKSREVKNYSNKWLSEYFCLLFPLPPSILPSPFPLLLLFPSSLLLLLSLLLSVWCRVPNSKER